MTKRGLICPVLLLLVLSGTGLHAAPAETPMQQAPARYALVEIGGFIPEHAPPVYLLEPEQDVLHVLVDRLNLAAADDSLRGVIVRIRDYMGGWAKAQDLRRAMLDCQRAGKQVVCLLHGAGNLAYYVATAADRIVVVPAGQLMLVGVRAEAIFAGQLLKDIGVEAQLVQAGKFKGGAEPLTRTEWSQTQREVLRALVDDLYGQLRDALAEGRGVSAGRAEELLRGGPYTARQALREGLVDEVGFYDELVSALEREHGQVSVMPDYGRPPQRSALAPGDFSILSLLMGRPRPGREGPAKPSIVVLYAVGPILAVEPDALLFGEQVVALPRMRREVRRAAADADVRAIVLRVDSPGGSALASDLLWRELRLAGRDKPVVASFSDTAGSGGYYIGAAAQEIVAQPGTLTGSIGVLGGKIVVRGLMEKIGLSVDVVERGGATGLLSPFEDLSQADRRKLSELVWDTYETFVNRVAAGRPDMSREDVEQVAGGRVWTGRQALEAGLVDRLGGLEVAIARARQLAGIPEDQAVQIVRRPRARSLAEMLLFGSEDAVRLPGSWLGAAGALPPVARSYLAGLVALRGEMRLCLMPAALLIR